MRRWTFADERVWDRARVRSRARSPVTTTETEEQNMETYKFGRELEPGDVVLDLLGRTRMLTSVEPYPAESPLADLLEGARIGTFDGGWRMTLEASARFTVATVALDCDHETSVPGPAGTPTGRAWCSVCGESRKVAA